MYAPTQNMMNYANPGQQARVQKIQPPGSQINLGEFQTEYKSSSQMAYQQRMPNNKYVTIPV